MQVRGIVEATDMVGNGGMSGSLGLIEVPVTSSFLSVAKKLSATALSQQLPLRLMLGMKPCAASILAKRLLAYWLPRSEWNPDR
jgi:hypothetical protein